MKARFIESSITYEDLVLPRKKREPFNDPDRLFEIKYDGYRGMLFNERGYSRIISKNGKRIAIPPKVEREISEELPARKSIILDGELVSLNEGTGYPDFDRLASREGIIIYVAFDILRLGNEDLRELPLAKRRDILHEYAKIESQARLRAAFGVIGEGVKLFNAAQKHDLEGLVAKRLGSPYSYASKYARSALNSSGWDTSVGSFMAIIVLNSLKEIHFISSTSSCCTLNIERSASE